MSKFLPLEAYIHKLTDWRLTLCCLSPLSLELISFFLDQYHTSITSYTLGAAERSTLICTRLSYFCIARDIRYQQVFDVLDTIFGGDQWCQLNDFRSPGRFFHELGMYTLAQEYKDREEVTWHTFTPAELTELTAKFIVHRDTAEQVTKELRQSAWSKIQPGARMMLDMLVPRSLPHNVPVRTEDITGEHLQLTANPDMPLDYLLPWRESDLQFITAAEDDIRNIQLRGTEQKVKLILERAVDESAVSVEYDNKSQVGKDVLFWDPFFHVMYSVRVYAMEGTIKHVFQTSLVRKLLF